MLFSLVMLPMKYYGFMTKEAVDVLKGSMAADPHPARKGLLTVHSGNLRQFYELPLRGGFLPLSV
jgi:hypothetical protein